MYYLLLRGVCPCPPGSRLAEIPVPTFSFSTAVDKTVLDWSTVSSSLCVGGFSFLLSAMEELEGTAEHPSPAALSQRLTWILLEEWVTRTRGVG